MKKAVSKKAGTGKTSTNSRATAKTNKAPIMPIKPVPTGKGATKKAAKQPPGKRTMIDGKNRVQKKNIEDTPV